MTEPEADQEPRRLLRAMGLPDSGDDTAFTDADREALDPLMAAVRGGTLDLETAVRLTRALGRTMARLADWEVAAEVPLEQVGVAFERLMVYAWRRHLAAARARVEALEAADADLHTVRLTVGFADLVAFTALSNELDVGAIGDLVERFEARCLDVVAVHHGRVIKTLGDSVLFVCGDPDDALEIAFSVVEVIGRDPRMPDVRVGLATGSVGTLLGDVFGPPVNLAARLTSVARRNRVIADEETARALSADRFATRLLPARPLRGFGVVEPVSVRRH